MSILLAVMTATAAKIVTAHLINNASKANAKKGITLSLRVIQILSALKILTTNCVVKENALNFFQKKTKLPSVNLMSNALEM